MTDTPHEHDPESELDRLASGYVDGDLSADDRARVEADPHLLARVAEFRGRRQTLLVVGDLHDAATGRDTAVAAALAEFDRLRPTAPPAPTTVLRWRPRTTQRVLALAAAVVALGVVGVTVLGNQNNDTSTAAMSVPAEKVAQADAAGGSETVAAEINAAPVATIGAIDAPATAAITITDATQLLDLADQYGITASTAADVVARTSPTSPCVADGETFLSDVIYQGTLGIALVGTDGHARILDTNCAVLLDVAP